MEEGSQDLLGVTVSPEGMAQLKRLAAGTKRTFIGGILLSLVVLLNSLLQRIGMGDVERYSGNFPFYLEVKLHFWYVLLYCAIVFFQFYLLWIFSRRTAAACQTADSRLFNETLGLLNRYNRLAQLGVLVGLLFGALEVWVSYNFAIRAVLRQN